MSNNPSSPSRRERQIAARLEKILDSAAQLFALKGFHRTTTREIAEAAEVSEGTLYNYFDSKNDLLFAIMRQLVESQPQEAGPPDAVQLDARQLFTTLFHYRMDHIEKYAAMQQAILSEILIDGELRQRYYQQLIQPTLTSLEKQLQLRVALGQIRPVDTTLAARILTSMLVGLFILQVLGDPPVQSQWDALVETATTIVFDGMDPGNQPVKSSRNS